MTTRKPKSNDSVISKLEIHQMRATMNTESSGSESSELDNCHTPASDDMEDITAIAVMGVTGSGKSNFIKHATNSDRIKVGHSLQSCKEHRPLKHSYPNL